MLSKKNNNGITLVALVVTIIILLILATISIQSLTNTGLFKRAQEAKNATENAELEQQTRLNEYENALSGYYVPESKPKSTLVADNINTVLSTTDNTELNDAYGNKIVVPAGFKIVSDSTTNNAQTVNQGIVIEDATVTAEGTATSTSGSQFVWIPVGKIYTDVAKTEANAKNIELNRYTFDTSGNPTKQNESVVETYFQELETSNKGTTVAKSISNFKTSVATNGGYYIGRYEARKDSSEKITEKGTDQVYNRVTQLQAAELARNMYNSSKYTSDLMNSYAWDTATLFLQTCGTNATYSRQTCISTTLSQTGTNNQSTKDVQCNVYDMASNIWEWTTETCNTTTGASAVDRGGSYSHSGYYTSIRLNGSPSAAVYDRDRFSSTFICRTELLSQVLTLKMSVNTLEKIFLDRQHKTMILYSHAINKKLHG